VSEVLWALFGMGIGALAVISVRLRRAEHPTSNIQHPTSNERATPAGPAMKPHELRAALNVDDDHPLWRAVHQAIGTIEQDAMEQVLDAGNQSEAALLNYYNGAARHMQRLTEFLLDEREKARVEADIE
jgi:hypothetical protein